MSLIKRVAEASERLFPLALAENSWDNVGVLLGECVIYGKLLSTAFVTILSQLLCIPPEAPVPRQNANNVLLTIDLSSKVLNEAIRESSVGAIVAYHPPIFRPLKRLNLSDVKQSIILQCIAHGLSVYSPHTAVDAAPGGGEQAY